MIMVGMTTQRKEPIEGLFSLEDISSVKQQYNMSLRVPLFIKPYGQIASFLLTQPPSGTETSAKGCLVIAATPCVVSTKG